MGYDRITLLTAASAALLITCVGGAYLFGAVSYHRHIWPMPLLRTFKQDVHPYVPANGAIVDKYERLIGFREKQEIPCHAQTDRTMVLLIAGQSNAANSGGQRYIGQRGVTNYFAGKCYIASSPLLGTTSIRGEPWTLLGNKLIEQEKADQVILIPTAMSGTSIEQWQDGGTINLMLQSVLSDVSSKYRITHVLWHQGEDDAGSDMTMAQYTSKFMSLVRSLRRAGVDAPIYVSVATRCDLNDKPWRPDNAIAEAQRLIPHNGVQIFPGVDSDALVGPFDRVDDCHFGHSGLEKVAQAWSELLATPQR
jgi:hypothetical protein